MDFNVQHGVRPTRDFHTASFADSSLLALVNAGPPFLKRLKRLHPFH